MAEEGQEEVLQGEYPMGYHIQEYQMHFPSIQERSQLWKSFLPKQVEGEEVFDRLAAQFDFSPGVIREAAELAVRKAQTQGKEKVPSVFLYQACQQKISHRLGERAARVNAAYSWDDLVLEEGPKELLRQACGKCLTGAKYMKNGGFRIRLPMEGECLCYLQALQVQEKPWQRRCLHGS